MPRLQPGESEKIDRINRLVSISHSMNPVAVKDALALLLETFRPMILLTCKKWSKYFQDDNHHIIQWDVLVGDAEYWFIQYTLYKYKVDGSATYNKFIKDHIDQRIRFIYESEIKYRSKNIFPDPDKNSTQGGYSEDTDTFEDVVNRYGSLNNTTQSYDDMLVDKEHANDLKIVSNAILVIIDDHTKFSDRERMIFTQCAVKGRTHQDISNELHISRTRVSQIMAKIRIKIIDGLDGNVRGWEEMIK